MEPAASIQQQEEEENKTITPYVSKHDRLQALVDESVKA